MKYCYLLLSIYACFASCIIPQKINLDFLNEYSEEEINHFIATGFYNGDYLIKWNSDLKVAIEGNYTQDDLETIDNMIHEFDSILSLSISIVDSGANVIIDISDPPSGHSGLANMTWSSNGNIIEAHMWVSPFNFGNQRKSIIHHEFLHVLGLSDPNINEYKRGILGVKPFLSYEEYDQWIIEYELPDIVKSTIEILYNNNLYAKMKKQSFLKQYQIKKTNNSN